MKRELYVCDIRGQGFSTKKKVKGSPHTLVNQLTTDIPFWDIFTHFHLVPPCPVQIQIVSIFYDLIGQEVWLS